MRYLSTFLLFIACTIILNSCCTKKDCAYIERGFKLKFVKGSDFYQDTYLAVFKKNSFNEPVDTISFHVGPPCNGCPYDYEEGYLERGLIKQGDLRDFSYIIYNNTVRLADTISSLGYTTEMVTTKCNTCFLAKDDYTYEANRNHVIYINGSAYYGKEPGFVFGQ